MLRKFDQMRIVEPVRSREKARTGSGKQQSPPGSDPVRNEAIALRKLDQSTNLSWMDLGDHEAAKLSRCKEDCVKKI